MNAIEHLDRLEREVAACHRHGADEYRKMARTLDLRANEEERAGHDPRRLRECAERVRQAGERYREAHRCSP